jgi:hypothetical protein
MEPQPSRLSGETAMNHHDQLDHTQTSRVAGETDYTQLSKTDLIFSFCLVTSLVRPVRFRCLHSLRSVRLSEVVKSR